MVDRFFHHVFSKFYVELISHFLLFPLETPYALNWKYLLSDEICIFFNQDPMRGLIIPRPIYPLTYLLKISIQHEQTKLWYHTCVFFKFGIFMSNRKLFAQPQNQEKRRFPRPEYKAFLIFLLWRGEPFGIFTFCKVLVLASYSSWALDHVLHICMYGKNSRLFPIGPISQFNVTLGIPVLASMLIILVIYSSFWNLNISHSFYQAQSHSLKTFHLAFVHICIRKDNREIHV